MKIVHKTGTSGKTMQRVKEIHYNPSAELSWQMEAWLLAADIAVKHGAFVTLRHISDTVYLLRYRPVDPKDPASPWTVERIDSWELEE